MKFQGLTRVMISDSEATTPARAHRMGSHASIAFLRKDGWVLGAPKKFEAAAYNTWPKEWTHYTTDFDRWRPIGEYKK